MKKIRLVIDVELHQGTLIGPEIMKRAWGLYSNYEELLKSEEWMSSVPHEQALLTTLLADPKRYKDFVIQSLHSELEMLGYQDFFKLAGLPAESDAIRDVIPALPASVAAYFEHMQDEGVLSENTSLVSYSAAFDIKSIRLEGLESDIS